MATGNKANPHHGSTIYFPTIINPAAYLPWISSAMPVDNLHSSWQATRTCCLMSEYPSCKYCLPLISLLMSSPRAH
ncbi:hypothetical protein BDW59DRAFT_155320 [Aspergillus cavernicola]|uniref:Uncharacterized protein n=1 Tax=Aspergillus cavernicola TaxID=176166 RepID=A0ABR4H9U1_9EURO